MALMKLILQQPVTCMAVRCQLHVSYTSVLRSCQSMAYSKTAVQRLSTCLNSTARTPVVGVLSKQGLITRLLGRMQSETQSKCYLHQTLLKYAKKKLPFEVDGNVLRDTLIFTYRNDMMFRMITFFGIAQFFFWVYMAFVTDMVLKQVNVESLQKQPSTFSGRVLIGLKDYSLKISAMCILLGNVLLFFTVIYPKRSVRSLTLLKGGKNVKITTYTYFGKTTQFTVPLEEISCMQSRQSKGTTLAMKIKGHWWYYMLDKKSGVFHQPELFDHVVGLQRNLK